jgi:hypothetical protein
VAKSFKCGRYLGPSREFPAPCLRETFEDISQMCRIDIF